MKKIVVLLLTLIITVAFSGCKHEHIWEEATCIEAKRCSTCGVTEGDALGHNWLNATCTEPVTCSRCGETAGDPLGHSWIEASCVEPKHCNTCGATEGEPLGHDWIDATYDSPKTCTRCGETEGEPLLHEIPAGFCDDYEYGDFDRFNSPASENGLGDSLIWVTGSFDELRLLDVSSNSDTINAYITVFKDTEGHEWLLELDLDSFSPIDKYTAIEGHQICVKGRYEGYSGVYEAPSILMIGIFDQTTGNMLSGQWYKNL